MAEKKKQSSPLPKLIGAGLGGKKLYDTFGLGASTGGGALPSVESLPTLSGIPSSFSVGTGNIPVGEYNFLESGAPSFGVGANGANGVMETTPQVGGLGTLGTAASALAALHGGKGVYDSIQKGNAKSSAMSGAEAGAGISTLMGFGPLPGAGIGALTGAALGHIKTAKSAVQQQRDSVRDVLQKMGVADQDYNVGLADGKTFDIGKDGKARLANADGKSRAYYDVDFSQKGVGDVVGLVNPLASIVTGNNAKMRSDFAGYFTNAVTSSGDPQANTIGLYRKAGFDTPDKAFKAIDEMVAAKTISAEDATAFRNGINQVFGKTKMGGAPVQAAQAVQQQVQAPQAPNLADKVQQMGVISGPKMIPTSIDPRFTVDPGMMYNPVAGFSVPGWRIPKGKQIQPYSNKGKV